jgi:predicted unusual protein kinase regulating ubiquinone biosynthesis (AarF/ABC1/UbiB family)
LQDQVPAFPTDVARQIIEEELGQSVDSIFSEFSTEPVAAASLGQVFKAKLRSTGQEVAVKVQRPNIMNQIALDMHLLREIAPVAKRSFNLNSDTVGTVDAWGLGFVDELDYIAEAENAEYFTESIQATPLKGVVFSPPIIEECTTGKILTTEWVIGERLDKSSSEDVTILCSIAMNTYLTMMLETGVLHCDPHPGNLLRTPEGKLCILDWGMVTRLDPDLQVTLIEHMAHLTSADYAEVPRDLLLLGFIPESKADLIEDSGIVEVLANVYGQWTSGGGVNGINVNEVIASLQDLTEKKGNLFQIPPYFAYIAKSFSVLEGIGLSNDPKYSIINECLPYVSRRLLTDKSERTGGALSTFIFGPTKNDANRIIDYDRVEQLISGFGEYTTSASGASLGLEKSRVELINDLADQVLDLLATEEETPLQTIFIEQIAKIMSSSSRSLWSELRERSGKLPTGRTVLGTLVDPLGLFRTSPVVRMNSLDEETIESTRNLINLLGEQAGNNGNAAFDASNFTGAEIQQLTSTLVQKIWSRRSGILKTGNRLATKLLQLTADKLESGEREVLILPGPSVPMIEASTFNDGKIHQETVAKSHSERLTNARRILEEAEREESLN